MSPAHCKPVQSAEIDELTEAKSKAMSEHTPTPWELFEVNDTIAIKNPRHKSSHNEIVFWTGFDASHYPKQARANAAFIVRAVNSHDALIERAENALECLRNAHDQLIEYPELESLRITINVQCRAISAALAQVKP
jgi:hypothetical protein